MIEASDEELVERIKEGEKDAFRNLYLRYLPKVYGFAYTRVGNRADAENIVSETFLKAFSNLSQFRAGSFSAWLFAIARNEVAVYWRERYGTESLIKVLVSENSTRFEDGDESKRRSMEVITRLLGRLPDNYRRVLILRFLEGKSLSEVAEEMGTTEGNVRVMQHRALKRAAELGWDNER